MPRDDDVSPIPSISASRDTTSESTAVPRPRGSSRSRNSKSGDSPASKGGGAGPLTLLVLGATLLIAISACAWAWNLQESLTQAGHAMERYEKRIADLEDRLADTDEGMSQNATIQAAKIRELDSEVRKLWDNVWKRSRERLGKLEVSEKRFESGIAANSSALEATQAELGQARTQIAGLEKTAGDLQRFATTARSSQAEVERVADTLNTINLELTRLGKRVSGNEEWISAINAFRQSTNASISQLQAQLRTMQGGATGGG